jgi:hypothetical protein
MELTFCFYGCFCRQVGGVLGGLVGASLIDDELEKAVASWAVTLPLPRVLDNYALLGNRARRRTG